MLQAWVGGGIEQSVLTSQMEDNNAQNPESHEREQQLLQGESKGTREKRKKRWGAEKVEALTLLEQHHQQGEPAGSQQTTPDASSQQQQVEPAQKKRRSRWEEPAPPQAIICSSGMPIQLPQSLAHLIDINPESLELNRQLNVVSYVLGLVKMNVSRFAGRTSFISFHKHAVPQQARCGDYFCPSDPLSPRKQVNQKLQNLALGHFPEDYPPEGQRSPSPEPMYNELGVRINTRDQRLRESLLRQRNVCASLTRARSSSPVSAVPDLLSAP